MSREHVVYHPVPDKELHFDFDIVSPPWEPHSTLPISVEDKISELTTLIQRRVNDEVMTAASSGINTVEGLRGVVMNCLSTLVPELLELISLKKSLGETLDVTSLISLSPTVIEVLSRVNGTVTGLTSTPGLDSLLGGSCTTGNSSLLTGITSAATSRVGTILGGVTATAAVCWIYYMYIHN